MVSFASTTQTILNHVLIDSAAARTAAAALVTAAPFIGTNTNYALAFTAMQAALTSSPNNPGLSYVNFATDGVPNEGGTGVTERNNLIAAGIDNISIEGIGISAAGKTLLMNNFCFPQACDDTLPFNFPAQGFYIEVNDPAGYAEAIGRKIQVVTGQVPEPTTMFLLGSGLLVAGRRLRRK